MLKLNEADVTAQIRGYLEHRGWRPIRFQRTVMPGQFSTGEPGMPDFCFVRYIGTGELPAATLMLWCEFKQKGARAKCRCATKKPRQRCTLCDQKAWRDRERSRGAVVWTQVDSIDWVMREYERCFGWLHQEHGRGQLELLLQGAMA
jgi:hypothetical protein